MYTGRIPRTRDHQKILQQFFSPASGQIKPKPLYTVISFVRDASDIDDVFRHPSAARFTFNLLPDTRSREIFPRNPRGRRLLPIRHYIERTLRQRENSSALPSSALFHSALLLHGRTSFTGLRAAIEQTSNRYRNARSNGTEISFSSRDHRVSRESRRNSRKGCSISFHCLRNLYRSDTENAKAPRDGVKRGRTNEWGNKVKLHAFTRRLIVPRG